jgi:predicted ester cyclase
VEPFVALMRTYCIDYTNSHDLSVCDSIMEPGYVVHIAGMSLERDAAYKPAVEQVFDRFPALGLVVHELATNGQRLVMRFSEHAATPEGTLACWSGIGLYDWNGTRLTSCRVEQDFVSQQRQLEGGVPHPLQPPHLDPWITTVAEPADAAAEAVARAWLATGDLTAAASGRIDEAEVAAHAPILAVTEVEVHDLFSAGVRVAFHASVHGRYTGGLDGFDADGRPVWIDVAGILTVRDGAVATVQAVTDRFGAWLRLAGAAEAAG